MKKYKCELCTKEHAVYYSSDSPLPNIICEINEKEEDNRIDRLADTAFIVDNEKLIIKGILHIDTNFSEDSIEHYVWTEIPAKDFAKEYENLKSGKKIHLNGILISELPFFEKSLNLKSQLTLDASMIYGQLKIVSEGQLKTDQKEPITQDRIIQMMQRIDHPELWKQKQTSRKSFKKRLSKILSTAKSDYKSNGKFFVVDISNQRENILQLISSELLVNPSSIGVGLHLSNDGTNLDYQHVKSTMTKICQSSKISHLVLDEIETYQNEYHINDEALFYDIEKIVKEVFNENIEQLEIDIFEP